MGCTYARVIWQTPFFDCPYLKCQVIFDFELQCRLVKCHRTHVGPSALSFSRQGAPIWIMKSKIPYFSYDREKTADSQIPFRCSTLP